MPRICLLHWKQEECAVREPFLKELGYRVDALAVAGPALKEIRNHPPDAVVIDLSRLPSHGREFGIALRQSKATRLIPLIYVEGDPEKTTLLKTVIPDARFTSYAEIGPVLQDVLANPPREAFVPRPLSSSATPVPLQKKLGLKDGQPVGLVNAPRRFESAIPGAVCRRNPRERVPLTLWFVSSRKELDAALPQMRLRAEDGGLWILWPKQTAALRTDVNGNGIRAAALALGLVDFKICAVDQTWSGMRFAVKR